MFKKMEVRKAQTHDNNSLIVFSSKLGFLIASLLEEEGWKVEVEIMDDSIYERFTYGVSSYNKSEKIHFEDEEIIFLFALNKDEKEWSLIKAINFLLENNKYNVEAYSAPLNEERKIIKKYEGTLFKECRILIWDSIKEKEIEKTESISYEITQIDNFFRQNKEKMFLDLRHLERQLIERIQKNYAKSLVFIEDDIIPKIFEINRQEN